MGASASAVPEPLITSGHFANTAPGVQIHYAECQPPSGVEERGTCMMLHGFPDFHGSWRAQMPALAAAGYRVVAPDLRGYGRSSKPSSVEDYGESAVVADIAALSKHISPGRPLAMIAGHDWGAFVAWRSVAAHPAIADRLAILNVPHPARFAEGLTTWKQLQKSWYIFAFQVPWLPEALFELADFALLRRVLETDPDACLPREVINAHVAAFASNPGAMSAAVNYYRAAGRALWESLTLEGIVGFLQQALRAASGSPAPKECSVDDGVIQIPVQVIWGERDRYLGLELAEPPDWLVPNRRPTRFIDATHWVHWDCPEDVNEELLKFLQSELH